MTWSRTLNRVIYWEKDDFKPYNAVKNADSNGSVQNEGN